MDDDVKHMLLAADIDVEGVLERFMGNEALFLRFFKKFGDDESYRNLKESIKSGEWQNAFCAVHTLKGVAGNLGMNRLFAVSSDITEKLRNREETGLEREIAALDAEYDAVLGVISQLP